MRNALVTGGSRGIGRAAAVALARGGHDLVGIHFASNAEAAKEAARLVEAEGATTVLIEADLGRDAPAAAAYVAREWLAAVREHGDDGVDVLVNNAGIGSPQELHELDPGTVRQVLEVDLVAPLFLTQALAPHLRSGGRVVNVSTGFTRIAAPTHVAYAAAKAGLDNVTLALAKPLAARGVTINAVAPGVTDTDMNADWLDAPGGREAGGAWSVFGRVGRPEEVADVIAFLASPASGWVTGQVLDATGGSAL